MKIKVDFVTNSSSSSFVVMGAGIDMKLIPEEIIKKIMDKEDVTPQDIFDYPSDYIEDLLTGTDLDYSFGYDYEGDLEVGIHYTKMKEDETLREFKERVKQQIKDSLGIDVEPGHIENCWMDN